MNQSTQLRCFLIGSDTLLIECAEALLDRGHSVVGVISATQRIADYAQSKGIATIDERDDYARTLQQTPFDFLFSITNLAILRVDVPRLPQRGSINFHDGPLPRYAGIHAPAWAIINEEITYGVTWHLM